jgi:CHAT domain-containing protein/Flp pilus assembly protein TadD
MRTFCVACIVLLSGVIGGAQTVADTARIDKLLDDGFAALPSGKYLDMARMGEEALRLSTAAGDTFRISRSLILLGSANFNQTHLPEALDQTQRGLALAVEVKDIPLQMLAKQVLGNTLRSLGRFDEALHSFEDWRTLNRQLPKAEPEARIARAIGILYYQMGDIDKAETNYRDALKFARDAGDVSLQAATLLSIGAVDKTRGQFPEAIRVSEEALALAQGAKMTSLQAEILNSLGSAYGQMGQLDKAAEKFRASMELALSTGYRGLEAQVTERLGTLEGMRKNYKECVDLLTRATTLYLALGDPPEARWTVELALGQAEGEWGHPEESLAHYRKTIALIERLEQFALPSEMSRALPISMRRAVFEQAANLLVTMGRAGDALEIADRSRARAFLELLHDSKIDLRASLAPADRDREDELAHRVAAARDQPKALADAIDALEHFYLDLRRNNPAYANLQRPEFATVAGIQHDLLDSHTAFIEYMLGETNSLAWVVTPTEVRTVALPARAEIQKLVQSYRDDLAATRLLTVTADQLASERSHAQQLYAMLLAPLAGSLGAATRVIVVADGTLAYVPFESLRATPTEFVIDRHAVAYAQSASSGLALRGMWPNRPRPTKTLVAYGDPLFSRVRPASAGPAPTALPSTRDEVTAIGALFRSSDRVVHLGSAATESAVKSDDLSTFKYIHFAVHGEVDEDHPARSGLILADETRVTEDGVLRMDEIARLRLSADVVTLSACRTGVGKLLSGEGLMSLSRAFFYAGARHVVASLWNVNDESTAQLMKDFYAQMEKGLAPADALRQAKLRMLHGSNARWQRPYFWAAFAAFE